jgi:phosphatidylglycerol lysyltransferase
MRRGLAVLAAAFVFTLCYGTLGFYLLDEYFKVRFSLPAALDQTIAMFASFSNPGLEPIRGFGRDFAYSIYVIAAVTFGYALVCLLYPVAVRDAATAPERARARGIVEAHGDNGFAFCALMDDKRYWFSPGGSLVAYALVGRVAVAMGDPIGPKSDAAGSITGWVNICRGNDWRPAFYEVYDTHLKVHREAGLRVLRIAHEAFVDVAAFTLAGGENKGLRSTVNGARNRGLRAEMHEPPLSDEVLERLRVVSNEWLARMHGGEKTFSLGAFEDDYIRHCPVMAIYHDHKLIAFANVVSCYHSNESTIDLMRRVHDSPQGTMELLFVSLFEWAKSRGFEIFNLGASPFAMVGEHSEDPATEKAINFIYEHIDQFYNFKGLHAFKEKFHPFWRPLYLTYDGVTGLPVVAAAVIRADSGQDSWWDFLLHLRGDSGAASAGQVATATARAES